MQERPTGKNLPVYASLSTMRQEPSQSEMNNGVIPLDTLPAAWWNWMWNAITQAQNDSMYNDDVLFTEINNVLAAAGITPGTSSHHDQLRQAINVIKGAIATTAEAGSVLSTDSGTTGTVKVAADGRMTVNNFGDIASFHGAAKDNLMGALNETYDIAYGSNDSVGELSTLTTTAKDNLVAAINELDAGKAPTMHASAETTYGIGNADNYGHVKLTDTPGSADAASGTAATPKLVQDIVSGGMSAVNAVTYTFVVDSNEAFAAWANNDRSKGQDYTSVLIRRGTWTSTKGVDLTNAGTYSIKGEPGSKLVFNLQTHNYMYTSVYDSSSKGVAGLYYQRTITSSTTCPEYYIRDLDIEFNVLKDNTDRDFSEAVAILRCVNIERCKVVSKATCTTHTSRGYVRPIAFGYSQNLRNNYAMSEIITTYNGNTCAIGRCRIISHCHAESYLGESRESAARGTGFFTCYDVYRCTGKTGGAHYYESYTSSTSITEYACANTPAGGFNV